MRYEGFGPYNVALIIETLTDNKNRSASSIRTVLQKNGGRLGESGSTTHLFYNCGVIHIDKKKCNEEEIFEKASNYGAKDCFSLDNYISSYKNFNITSVYTRFLDQLKFDSLDDSNFDYVKIPIGHMVGQHKDLSIDIIDNHMSVEQNMKFAKFVYDIIMYNEPDKSWFVKDRPYDDVMEMDRPSEPLYIYE